MRTPCFNNSSFFYAAIFYALVARKSVVLAEFTGRAGNFPQVTRTLLEKIKGEADSKQSYLYDQFTFHYITERGVTYLCLTDEKNKRRLPFSFLDDVKGKFQQTYSQDRINVAIAFAMNAEFSRVLEDRLNYFNDNPNADAFGKVKGQLDEVKGVMVDNIEKVRKRGEGARARAAAHRAQPSALAT